MQLPQQCIVCVNNGLFGEMRFCRRAHEQQLIQKDHIRPATYARLSPAARFILDV